MKNITILAAITAMLAIVSCNKTLDTDEAGFRPEEGQTNLTVTLGDVFSCETKTSGQTDANELKINSCQVFVFRKDNGKVDACTYAGSLTASGSHSVSLKCTTGERNVYAIVNAVKDYTSTVKDESSLLALTTELKDNSASSLFMIGNTSSTLTEGSCSVSVSVARAAASITLNKISVSMDAAAYRGAGMFKLNKIYLLNVCGRTDFGLSAKPSSVSADYWYAKLKEETDSSRKTLIADDLASPVTIENGASYEKVYTYYAYPNDCAHSTSATFSQRATLLVVEATLDGETYYYPLKLDKIQSNKRYIISNLTIHRPGSKSPYSPVLFATASANISVAAWGSGSTSSVEI